MKSVTSVFLIVTMLALALAVPPTSAPALQGATIVVTSTADSGPGTLRQAMEQAQSGDTIIFDPAVFPPTAPVTISITSELPHIHANNLLLDASNAGVILDGSQLPGDWEAGLQIVSSHGSSVRGLQIANFSGPAIAISGDARNNAIGGDRAIGSGPFGQGNQFIHNDIGVSLSTPGTTLNVITGNLMGTDADGVAQLGNERSGVWICEGAHDNTVGPDNVIAYNDQAGIMIEGPGSTHNIVTQNSIHDNGGPGIGLWGGTTGNTIGPDNFIAHNDASGIIIQGSDSLYNTITQNSIHDNGLQGISLEDGGNTDLFPPTILDFDLAAGTVNGFACPNCTVEIFSDSDNEGEVYEGQTTADGIGVFTFTKGVSFTGPHLTASATDPDGNTSEFSTPTSGTHRTLSLQQENNLPRLPLSPKPSQFLLDNHIGAWFEAYDRYYDTGFVYRNGFKRMRIGSLAGRDQGWLTIINSESLSAEVDETISEYTDNGVEIVLILASGAGLPAWTTTFQSEEEIEQYLEYVSFAVSHFKGRIRYYEVWNEPINIIVSDSTFAVT
jgi:hypothetical protein